MIGKRTVGGSMLRALIVFLSLAAALPAIAEDQWAIEQPETPLAKWCQENGPGIRYANHPVPGYKQCGTLKSSTLCDASGRRFISQSGDSAAYTYRDCSVGPRIQVKSSAVSSVPPEDLAKDPGLIDFQDSRTGERKAEMSPAEKAQMKKRIEQAKREQEKESAKEINEFIQQMLSGFGGFGNSRDLQDLLKPPGKSDKKR